MARNSPAHALRPRFAILRDIVDSRWVRYRAQTQFDTFAKCRVGRPTGDIIHEEGPSTRVDEVGLKRAVTYATKVTMLTYG